MCVNSRGICDLIQQRYSGISICSHKRKKNQIWISLGILKTFRDRFCFRNSINSPFFHVLHFTVMIWNGIPWMVFIPCNFQTNFPACHESPSLILRIGEDCLICMHLIRFGFALVVNLQPVFDTTYLAKLHFSFSGHLIVRDTNTTVRLQWLFWRPHESHQWLVEQQC